MSRMQDKRCLVSGAARGIGLAVCERLIEEGAQVMMADIDAASGERQAQRLGEHAVFQPLDVTAMSSGTRPSTRSSGAGAGWMCWSTTPASP